MAPGLQLQRRLPAGGPALGMPKGRPSISPCGVQREPGSEPKAKLRGTNPADLVEARLWTVAEVEHCNPRQPSARCPPEQKIQAEPK